MFSIEECIGQGDLGGKKYRMPTFLDLWILYLQHTSNTKELTEEFALTRPGTG